LLELFLSRRRNGALDGEQNMANGTSAVEWFYSPEITAKREQLADTMLSLLEAQLADAKKTGESFEVTKARALATLGKKGGR
jgi:hypothetical protein